MKPNANPYRSSFVGDVATVARRLSLATLFAATAGIPLAVDLVILLVTGQLVTFLLLFEQAASLLIFTFPILIPLATWMAFASGSLADIDQYGDRHLLWLAPLIVLPITMLVWGAVFAHPRGIGFSAWQLGPLHWGFRATVVITLMAVVFNRGRRSFVTATGLLLLLFSWSCSFTAGSSVSGDWL